MNSDNHIAEASKFLSFVLRHKPDDIGLTLDREGWAEITTLIACAVQAGKSFDLDLIYQVLACSDKKRFAISSDGLHIRALQGHSTVCVAINYPEMVPPEFLYHGTATRFLPGIRDQGLVASERQFVHLSQDEKTAFSIGQRHGIPVVLTVTSRILHERGFKFFQAENGVWLTDNVPVAFLILHS
jgi:putative RNA 2'-phosphotransferase